jgi:hypothetical protein
MILASPTTVTNSGESQFCGPLLNSPSAKEPTGTLENEQDAIRETQTTEHVGCGEKDYLTATLAAETST